MGIIMFWDQDVSANVGKCISLVLPIRCSLHGDRITLPNCQGTQGTHIFNIRIVRQESLTIYWCWC